MLVDSHCHLDFPDFAARLDDVLTAMKAAGVGHALCPCVSLERFPAILELARRQANVFAAVGVHPDGREGREPDVETLGALASDAQVVAIGETGLDYYRLEGDVEGQRESQRQRFRVHIRAARAAGKPLIVHTRAAAEDTLRLMREEGADECGGVMHCFTETLDVAEAAMALGFYISFSGIVTFKNAQALKAVAASVPSERMLIETDAPYLAPAPYRGKVNQPAYVVHVAEELARLRGVPVQAVASATTENFFRLFKGARP